MHLRSADGNLLAPSRVVPPEVTDPDRNWVSVRGFCSQRTITLSPGETVYLHIVDIYDLFVAQPYQPYYLHLNFLTSIADTQCYHKPDGTSCGQPNACSEVAGIAGTCQVGECVPVCPPPDLCHSSRGCDVGLGQCQYVSKYQGITTCPVDFAIPGGEYRYQVQANFTYGLPNTYTLLQGPAEMTIDPVTGEIRWSFGLGAVNGTQTVIVLASDGIHSEQQRFEINVPGTKVIATQHIEAATGGKIVIAGSGTALDGVSIEFAPGTLVQDETIAVAMVEGLPQSLLPSPGLIQPFVVVADLKNSRRPFTVKIPVSAIQMPADTRVEDLTVVKVTTMGGLNQTVGDGPPGPGLSCPSAETINTIIIPPTIIPARTRIQQDPDFKDFLEAPGFPREIIDALKASSSCTLETGSVTVAKVLLKTNDPQRCDDLPAVRDLLNSARSDLSKLGFRQPDHVTVLITDSVPSIFGGGAAVLGTVFIDPSLLTDPISARNVLLHEYFHLVEFESYLGCSLCDFTDSAVWLIESSSVFIEDKIFDSDSAYVKKYAPFDKQVTSKNADRLGIANGALLYQNVLFLKFLEKTYGFDLAGMWDYISQTGDLFVTGGGYALLESYLPTALGVSIDDAYLQFSHFYSLSGDGQFLPEIAEEETGTLDRAIPEPARGAVDKLRPCSSQSDTAEPRASFSRIVEVDPNLPGGKVQVSITPDSPGVVVKGIVSIIEGAVNDPATRVADSKTFSSDKPLDLDNVAGKKLAFTIFNNGAICQSAKVRLDVGLCQGVITGFVTDGTSDSNTNRISGAMVELASASDSAGQPITGVTNDDGNFALINVDIARLPNFIQVLAEKEGHQGASRSMEVLPSAKVIDVGEICLGCTTVTGAIKDKYGNRLISTNPVTVTVQVGDGTRFTGRTVTDPDGSFLLKDVPGYRGDIMATVIWDCLNSFYSSQPGFAPKNICLNLNGILAGVIPFSETGCVIIDHQTEGRRIYDDYLYLDLKQANISP